MVFFVLLLAFSRVGVALGMGPTPVGIGNFFLGSPSITESNLNQVLGLLVGPAGSPGPAGVSGANGRDGLNETFGKTLNVRPFEWPKPYRAMCTCSIKTMPKL